MLRETDVDLDGAPSTAKRLQGRVAVVTGSSRGIGRAIARVLAAEGASVAVHYCRGEEQAASLAAEIEHLGAKARLVQGDLGRPEDCHKVLTLAARDLGPVEILVNNAGVNRDRTLRKMTVAEWDEVMQVNLNSVFHCTKAALEPMIGRGWRPIINIASIIGQTGALGQANYAAAKAGIIAFTKSVAQELARFGITVNAICPGMIDTELTREHASDELLERLAASYPVPRLGTALEVADLICFAASESAGYITGASLDINGGELMM